jgi:GT2 family glycosyltransferase/MoaA/NifB/PqqE/SkfB family radical SAM enzyme
MSETASMSIILPAKLTTHPRAETPPISIIIPANKSTYLSRCIDSVREQGFDGCEIVLVNDGSRDDLRDDAKKVDVYLKNTINVGPAYGRNLGVLRSRGTLLVFMDSDAELRPGTLAQLPAIFDADPSIGAVGGSGPPDESGKDVQFISGKSYDSLGRSVTTRYRPADHPNGFFDCDHLEAAFLCVRRDSFERIGGFDPGWGYMGEDRDLCLRLKDAGYRVVACMATRAIHHCLGGKDYSDRASYEQFVQKKALQVAIKRNGIPGGVKWLIGNHRISRRPSRFIDLVGAFKDHRELTARRGQNHLTSSRMDQFYGTKVSDALERRLPFKVESPLRSPRNIVFFVNAICNALCDHCFIIHDEMPQQDRRQIPLESVLKTFRSLNAPVSISLTGGETFMRKDLKLMLHELMDLPVTRAINVFSNGSTPEHIEKVCTEVCERSRKPLYLQLSLDGLEARHDEIRKIPKGFRKVLDTCERAARLHTILPHFGFVVAITVMKQNLAEIEPLVDELENRGYHSKLTIVRGNSFSTFGVPAELLDGEYNPNAEVQVDIAETEQVFKRIAAKHQTYFDRGQERKVRLMLDTLKSKRRLIPCYAGYEDAVVYNDGSLTICEQVKPFGNLAAWDFNFLEAWNSREAMEHRLKLTRCACIHGCNISTSVGMELGQV